MASAKIILYKHKVLDNGTSPIVIQIIHKRIRRIFSLKCYAKINNWDDVQKKIKIKNKADRRLIIEQNLYIQSMLLKAQETIFNFEKNNKAFTADDVIRKLKGNDSANFISFTLSIIDELKKESRFGNARSFATTLSMLKKFLDTDDISFDLIDYKFLKQFDTYLISRGNVQNTRTYYFKAIRAIYNRAIKEGVAKRDNYPFREFKIKFEKTQKRALTKEEISKIKNLNITNPAVNETRDYFMFSFYCMGMSFVDIAHLKTKNIFKNRIIYARQKTSQKYNIKLTEPALKILNKYADLSNPEEFLFPILRNNTRPLFEYYKYKLTKHNLHLKDIQKKLDLSLTLTSYVARHSWATIAKRAGISTAIISEGLGHTTEKTTQIYLDSFENSVLDEANKIITL
jgi:site-specific recombinase XerD